MTQRKQISKKLYSQLLIANRHACCICGRGDIQVHHINGNNSDNSWSNLAVLCLRHHDKATAPKGLSATLSPAQINTYKQNWEQQCELLAHNLARSRAAFFMVDYKNAERIRELYSQLTQAERDRAYMQLRTELIAEDALRKEQGFDISLEPTTSWNPLVEAFVEEVRSGTVHPNIFRNAPGHPKDPLYPTVNFLQQPPSFWAYDLWCQIMVRVIIISRGTHDIESLMKLDDPTLASLSGSLVSFDGRLKGRVASPDNYKATPLSRITLTVRSKKSTWTTSLLLKTHYVYSVTGAQSLEGGRANGVLLFRSINRLQQRKGRNQVDYQATPLIIGSGALKISN